MILIKICGRVQRPVHTTEVQLHTAARVRTNGVVRLKLYIFFYFFRYRSKLYMQL